MRIRVYVRLKPGVLDVQGKAVERAVQSLSLSSASNFRIGRVVEFDVEGSLEENREEVERLCRELLANTIIEDFEVTEAQ